MRRLAVLACLAAGWLLATPALAQEVTAGDQVVVTLKSGATFRGTLVGMDERTLTLRSPAGTVRSLPRSSVGQVERASEAAAPAAPVAAGEKPAPVEPPAGGPPAIGDQVAVTLMSGDTVRGTLVGQDHWHLNVRTPGGPVLDLPLTSVNSVRREGGPSARPADGTPRAHLRIGLGVALPSAGDFPSFYVPIQLNPGFRVEPEIGVVRASSGGEDATALQVGLGLLGTGTVAPQVGAYGGLRLQLQQLDASGSGSITNVRVAAVVGGEWQPVPRVALGVEAQAAYVSIDRAFFDGQASGSGFATAGLIFVRVFLN